MTEGKKGRKRYIITDALGRLPAVIVHAATIHDAVGGTGVYDKAVAARLPLMSPRLAEGWHNRENQAEGMGNTSQTLGCRTGFRLGFALAAAFKRL
ncbi:MAG: hypothetical protein LBL45_11915 [Treponema sp.]|nr:hypothetical protein [Treponema sp.]